ncbi:hypothetical protein [Paracoccus suum]|nr:hypothetical protein [Paracoccus suum]
MKYLKFGELPKFNSTTVKAASEKISAAIKLAEPHADRALDWGRRQQERASSHLPNASAIEAWARKNAERYDWRPRPVSISLEHLEETLTQIVSAIRQTSDRRSRLFVNAVIGKLGGVLTVGGISGLVTTFGAASTGAALATLHGAAATSALHFWIGSLVGVGAVGGSLMLVAGGVGAGIAAGFWGKRKLFGKARSEVDLQEHEKAILVACVTLINATKQQRQLSQTASSAEMRLVAEQVLIPLANQINQHWDDASLKENGKSECEPFTRRLAYLQRRKLDQCRAELGRIALAAMEKDAAA